MKRLYGANSLQREAVYAAERFAAGAEKSARYAMFAALVAPRRRWSLPIIPGCLESPSAIPVGANARSEFAVISV